MTVVVDRSEQSLLRSSKPGSWPHRLYYERMAADPAESFFTSERSAIESALAGQKSLHFTAELNMFEEPEGIRGRLAPIRDSIVMSLAFGLQKDSGKSH